MSPNAMGNANASQITQLEEMKTKIDEKVVIQEKMIAHLVSAKDAMYSAKDAMYRVPEESTGNFAGNFARPGILLLAVGIGQLADSQLVLAEYSLSELKAQSLLLYEALSRAKSPIATATLHRPSLKL